MVLAVIYLCGIVSSEEDLLVHSIEMNFKLVLSSAFDPDFCLS